MLHFSLIAWAKTSKANLKLINERRVFLNLLNYYFFLCISRNLNILMSKMHPFFWCLILGQKSASYTRDGTVKYLTTACTTQGSVCALPCAAASSANFLTMFCLKTPNSSISSTVIARGWLAAIMKRKTSRGHMIMWSPHGGRNAGQSQQNSDIVLLCVYFLSN